MPDSRNHQADQMMHGQDTSNSEGHQSSTLPLRQLDAGGYVLPPQLCTLRRAQFFARANQILGTYAALTIYGSEGEKVLRAAANRQDLAEETIMRLDHARMFFQCNYRTLRKLFRLAGPQLTRQTFLMVFGNLEAFLSDLVLDAHAQIGTPDPETATVNLMSMRKWRGKIDAIAQKLDVKLPSRRFRKRYRDFEMVSGEVRYSDPIEFLQHIAQIRHRVVHYAGRVDALFLKKHAIPDTPLGAEITLPFQLPMDLFYFLVPLTDIFDDAFASRYDWERRQLDPLDLLSD